MTKRYGILAHPAKHSLSPVMHNTAFKVKNMDAQYDFFDVAPENLEPFMNQVRHDPIMGLSVSLPHKQSVMKYLDEIDENALNIGAVNTVLSRDGKLFGFNTDFIGSNRALLSKVDSLKDKIVVVLGAGGSARAVAYGLLHEGAHVWIKNRTKSKGDAIAMEFAEKFPSEIHSEDWDNWYTGDILINTTSFWLHNRDITEEELPDFCDEEFLKEFDVVMDISYNNGLENFPDPLITPLLAMAEQEDCEIITGEKMLYYQALEQFSIWTEMVAPSRQMYEALMVGLGIEN